MHVIRHWLKTKWGDLLLNRSILSIESQLTWFPIYGNLTIWFASIPLLRASEIPPSWALGIGHYLWPGWSEEKVGGAPKTFWCVESGHRKKIKSSEWESQHFFPKNFAAGAASFISLYYPFIARCRVGRKMFCPHTEWALNNFSVNHYFPPGPPVINNDRSPIIMTWFHWIWASLVENKKIFLKRNRIQE